MILNAKRIVVSGAFGALGTTVAIRLLAEGARVACLDCSSATSRLPSSDDCLLLEGVDLVDPTATGAAIDSASRQLGALDGVVNIAGGFAWEKLQGGDIRTWDKLYNTNLRTAVNVCQASLGKLSQGARIINMSAAGATKAGTGMGAYAASKAGVAKLTEALAEEMKDRGITVNAILPSIIDTAANRADMPHAKFDDWVKPEQIADLIVFLLSDRASAITGALIPITNRA